MKHDNNCLNLEGKLFPYCINKIWKESGCTTNPPLDLLQGKSEHEIQAIAKEYSKSTDKEKWGKCFGTTSNRGYGSKITFNGQTNCQGELRNEGELISCQECQNQGKRNEGIWLYKNGTRVWVPTCQCRSAYMAGNISPEINGNYDVCGAGYSQWKSIDNVENDCQLLEAWNNTENKWYYDANDIVGNSTDPPDKKIGDNNTIFYTDGGGTIHKVPDGKCSIKCGSDKINICHLGKVKSCRENRSDCIADTTRQIKSKLKPTNISAKCMYSIPIVNGTGESYPYYIGEKEVSMNAMSCDNPYLYNFSSVDAAVYIGGKIGINNISSNSIFLANRLYAFKGAKYYRLKPIGKNFVVEKKGNISQGWNNQLPFPIDGIFVNSGDSMLYILKGDDYYKFNSSTNKVVEVGKIADKFKGVPGNVDSVVQYSGKTVFFKDSSYYEFISPSLLYGPVVLPNVSRNIINYNYGMVVEIPLSSNWNIQKGARLRLAPPTGGENQIWVYDPITKNIINPASGFCIDILGENVNDQRNALPIITSHRADDPNKKWTYLNGQLVCQSSNKVLSFNANKELWIYQQTGGKDQYWTRPFGYVAEDWKAGQIIGTQTGMALAIGPVNSVGGQNQCPDGTWKYNGTPYSSEHPDYYGGFGTKGIWTNDTPCCNGDICKPTNDNTPNINLKKPGYKLGMQDKSKNTPNQWWIYDTFTKQVINPTSGFCIDIMNGVDENGAVVRTWSRIRQDGFQQWQWNTSSNYISPYYPGTSTRCLSSDTGSTNENSQVYMYKKGGSDAVMKWSEPLGYVANNASPAGTIFLYTGLPNGNDINNRDITNSEQLLKRDNSGIASFPMAVQAANQMGGRIACEYEVKILATKISNSAFGWTAKGDDYTAAGGKIGFINHTVTVGKPTDLAGVWIWASSGTQSLSYIGSKKCLATLYPTDKWEWKDDPRAYVPSKIKELCGDLGGCYKAIGQNNYCYASKYQPEPPKAKLISSIYSGIPNYVNACFVVNTNLYIIKGNLIYTIDNYGSKRSDKLNIVLLDFPMMENILGDANKQSEKEERDQKKFFKTQLDRLRSEGNVILRGKQAVDSTEIVLADQTNRTSTTKKNMDKLTSTNETLLRQTSINHNNFTVRDQYNKYLKMLLTFGLVQLMVTIALSADNFKKFRMIAQIVVIVIFLIYLVPSIIRNFKNSKNRWGLKQWDEKIPKGRKTKTKTSGGDGNDDDDDDDDDDVHDDHHHIKHKDNHELKSQCQKLDESTQEEEEKVKKHKKKQYHKKLRDHYHKRNNKLKKNGNSLDLNFSFDTDDDDDDKDKHKHHSDKGVVSTNIGLEI